MPRKMARSAPRPPFILPEVQVAVCTSGLASKVAGKSLVCAPVQESSGESRFKCQI
jgi:hypothetical protein